MQEEGLTCEQSGTMMLISYSKGKINKCINKTIHRDKQKCKWFPYLKALRKRSLPWEEALPPTRGEAFHQLQGRWCYYTASTNDSREFQSPSRQGKNPWSIMFLNPKQNLVHCENLCYSTLKMKDHDSQYQAKVKGILCIAKGFRMELATTEKPWSK